MDYDDWVSDINGYGILEDTFLPREEDLGTLQSLAGLLRLGEDEPGAYYLADAKTGVKVDLPEQLYEILLKAIIALSEGRALSVAPLSMRLSTQEAANYLGISRLSLLKLLDEGKIPYTRPRRHRLVQLRDLVNYRKNQQRQRQEALDAMVQDSVEMGFYDREIA